MNKHFFLIITLFIIINGCQSSQIIFPDCGIDEAHMNNEIQPGFMNNWNSYKKSDGTTIYITGEKQLPIIFPLDLNIQVFMFDVESQKWSTIKNQTITYGEGPLVMDNENNVVLKTITLDLPDSPKPVNVYFCVSGQAQNGIMVGASGEFTLNP